jgi:sirohydrochlorin ferrochelatase
MAEKDDATGILLFAHGSSVEEANRAVHELARQIEAQGPYGYVRAAFLERARPDLGEAGRRLRRAGNA